MIYKQYNRPILFYLLSTVIPWSLWSIVAYYSHQSDYPKKFLMSTIGFLGLLMPFVIALVLIWPKQSLRQDFLDRIFNFKEVKLKYWLITSFLMLTSILTAQLISTAFGYSYHQFQLREGFTFTSGIFPVWFLLIMAPVLEELAWHSYGTDCLINQFNLFKTSILFAFFWGVWHIPLSFIKDYYHSNLVESGDIYALNFLVSLFPFVVIMNWLYYKSNRNIFIPIIFHISAGYFNEIFETHPMSKVIQTLLLLLLSVYLLLNDRDFFFKLKTTLK